LLQVCSYTDPKYIALIMDPVADFNLAAYYIEAAQSREKLAQLRRFYGCLANALKYLHESKIRHRDIKPENILIKGPKVLLTDFGLSFDWEHLPHSTTTADLPKTAVYAAPEVANYERKKNSASDIWSLGCVFLEMVTVLKGETVLHMREFFRERTDNYLFHANMSGAKVWTHKLSKLGLEEDGIPVEWVANMLNRDPSKRPTAASLFSEILDCDTTVKFCGHCCENQETDESDDSEDDHDPLADTMQEMTVKPR
jgi:serine/threonine protein kinase